jgi:hypothetical protein
VALTLGELRAPPVGGAQLAGLGAFTLDVRRIGIQV